MTPTLKLSKMAPLTWSICWGFAVINLLLGIGLATLYETPIPLSVANLLNYQEWGAIFFLLGVFGVYSLVANRSHLVRQVQFVSVAVKAVWAIALIIRCISAPQTITITLVWLFFAYVQVMVYVHFIPSPMAGVRNGAN